jgi:two-component system sensor histidine kinase HydH
MDPNGAGLRAGDSRTGSRRHDLELERRERQLFSLHELIRGLPDLGLDALKRWVVERAVSALDAHTGSLFLRERGTETLRLEASLGLPRDISESVTLLVGERIAGRVAATRQPILLNADPRQHPMLRDESDIDRRPEVASALCAPLLGPRNGESLGVLCVSRHAPAAPFTEADLRILSLFASHAGAAIAHDQMVDDLTKEADERNRLELKVAHSEHLAQMGQFAATVAHELRNPLGAIKGAAQFLVSETADRPDLQDFLNIVIEEVDGLGRMTTDLLEFARPGEPSVDRVDLAALLHGELELLRPELARLGVTDLQVAVPDTEAWVSVDAPRIARGLRNLLLNAAQSVAQVSNSLGEGWVSVSIRREDDNWVLQIQDNGVGIPESVLPRIFEPFFTTKAKGTGLGLAQVKKDVEAHSGTIVASNRASGGALLRISLPAH